MATIKHIWSVLCTRSIIDSESNNISLMDVIEQITVAGPETLPKNADNQSILPFSFEVVSFWVLDEPSEGFKVLIKISVKNPDGTEDILKDFEIEFKNQIRFRSRLRMNGIKFKGVGRHYFEIAMRNRASDDWVEVSEIPLDVLEGGPPEKPK